MPKAYSQQVVHANIKPYRGVRNHSTSQLTIRLSNCLCSDTAAHSTLSLLPDTRQTHTTKSIKKPVVLQLFFIASLEFIHSLLVNKVTCRENKVGGKGGKGFGCPRKKDEECMQLFGGGQQAGQT